jgi:hypothetical protein
MGVDERNHLFAPGLSPGRINIWGVVSGVMSRCSRLIPLACPIPWPPQIRREAISKVISPNFRGNQRQKWIQLTRAASHRSHFFLNLTRVKSRVVQALPVILPVPRCHPRIFDEQLGSAVGAIDYVRGSGN